MSFLERKKARKMEEKEGTSIEKPPEEAESWIRPPSPDDPKVILKIIEALIDAYDQETPPESPEDVLKGFTSRDVYWSGRAMTAWGPWILQYAVELLKEEPGPIQ
jgi:hypothetical protein